MTLKKHQSQHDQDRLHDDAVKQEILAILKSDGPQFSGAIAKKICQPSGYVTRMLHELESNFEVEFKWTRGYMV